jgi:hypothetical protein
LKRLWRPPRAASCTQRRRDVILAAGLLAQWQAERDAAQGRVEEGQAELEATDRLIAAWMAMHRTLLALAGEAVSGEVMVQKGM